MNSSTLNISVTWQRALFIAGGGLFSLITVAATSYNGIMERVNTTERQVVVIEATIQGHNEHVSSELEHMRNEQDEMKADIKELLKRTKD